MKETDRDRLIHMLEASREAVSFLNGRIRDGYGKDRMLLLAVVKAIEIVGEAARNVSSEQRAKMPEISWSDVVSMRNQLSHGYFDWDLDIIWDTVHRDLPRLIPQVERALEPE